jgi:hypothetical protein
MTNKATIIIEGNFGRLETEFAKINTEGTTKKRIIKDLKEQFNDMLEYEFKEFNKNINNFEFLIYEDLTEKYKDV